MNNNLLNLKDGKVHIIINEISAEDGQQYYDYLDTQELKKINQITSEKRKLEFLYSRGYLKSVLGNYFENSKQLKIERTDLGKPYILKNEHLMFNISHTTHLFILALSYQEEIGVDIEKLNEKKMSNNLVDKIFCYDEKQYIEQDKIKHFFELWTQKESILKMTGEGIRQDLKKINTLEYKEKNYLKSWFDQKKQYCLSLAMKKNPSEILFENYSTFSFK